MLSAKLKHIGSLHEYKNLIHLEIECPALLYLSGNSDRQAVVVEAVAADIAEATTACVCLLCVFVSMGWIGLWKLYCDFSLLLYSDM